MKALKEDATHSEVREFVASACHIFQDREARRIHSYLGKRAQSIAAVRQDLLPLLVYAAVSGKDYGCAIPLAASWSLFLAAAHMLDHAQDRGNTEDLNTAVVALGGGNIALSRLEVDGDTLADLLDASGHALALAASAQSQELQQRQLRARQMYFRTIAGKAAAIVATGSWMGGRLATADAKSLDALKAFGLALGMVLQIADDCLDLREDLVQGVYTLPVIEGLAMTEHPQHGVLKEMVQQPSLEETEADSLVAILEEMGAVAHCRRIAGAYQAQAAAVFDLFPNLEQFLGDYVVPEI